MMEFKQVNMCVLTRSYFVQNNLGFGAPYSSIQLKPVAKGGIGFQILVIPSILWSICICPVFKVNVIGNIFMSAPI